MRYNKTVIFLFMMYSFFFFLRWRRNNESGARVDVVSCRGSFARGKLLSAASFCWHKVAQESITSQKDKAGSSSVGGRRHASITLLSRFFGAKTHELPLRYCGSDQKATMHTHTLTQIRSEYTSVQLRREKRRWSTKRFACVCTLNV